MPRGAAKSMFVRRTLVLAVVLAGTFAAVAWAAPTVTITGGPTDPTNVNRPSFGFTVEDATDFACSIDQGPPDFGECTSGSSHTPTEALADGDWTFRVQATDGESTATAARSFTVDTGVTVTIDSGPAEGTSTNDRTPEFGFTPEPGATVECSVVEGSPPPFDFNDCSSANSHTASRLSDGDWTFSVRVTDAAFNVARADRAFSVDATGPVVAIQGPKRTGTRKPTFQLSSPKAQATFRCRIDERAGVPCGPTFKPGRKLKPGRHALVATAFDALGNPGPRRTFRFRVLRPPLRPGLAERAVAAALRRHRFARQVVANLERTCDRRGRFKFSCRFSSTFPGYRLEGRGTVKRVKRLSYRFRVQAQGRTFVLTDENEGGFPG
jgi:Bacterial Ig-like domain